MLKKIKAFTDILIPDYLSYLRKDLSDCTSILDLGCGTTSVLKENARPGASTVGLELFRPALELAQSQGNHSNYIQADVNHIPIKDRTFDAVVALDVLEHLKLDENGAGSLLEDMARIAKKKVIVVTPNGFLDQDEYDGNPHQKHYTGWETPFFKRNGFKVYGVHGLWYLRREHAQPVVKPHAIGQAIAKASQFLVYPAPQLGFHLYCVKGD